MTLSLRKRKPYIHAKALYSRALYSHQRSNHWCSILKLKIEENRGDLRRNFVKFEDNLEKNRGESRRFSKVNEK